MVTRTLQPIAELFQGVQFRANGNNKDECDTFAGQVSTIRNRSLVYAGFVGSNIVERTHWIIANQNLFTSITNDEFERQYEITP